MCDSKKLDLKYVILKYLEKSGITREGVRKNLGISKGTFENRLADGDWTMSQMDTLINELHIPPEKVNSAMKWRPTMRLADGEKVAVVYM